MLESRHSDLSLKIATFYLSTPPVTMPLKCHIIADHLSDYFNIHGKTLKKVSDQVVEASHHKVKFFFESRPNYNYKEKESKESGEATLAGIIHFNSINI